MFIHPLSQSWTCQKMQKKDPDSVAGALEKYFTLKTNVVYERYVFGTTNQGTNETVD